VVFATLVFAVSGYLLQVCGLIPCTK